MRHKQPIAASVRTAFEGQPGKWASQKHWTAWPSLYFQTEKRPEGSLLIQFIARERVLTAWGNWVQGSSHWEPLSRWRELRAKRGLTQSDHIPRNPQQGFPAPGPPAGIQQWNPLWDPQPALWKEQSSRKGGKIFLRQSCDRNCKLSPSLYKRGNGALPNSKWIILGGRIYVGCPYSQAFLCAFHCYFSPQIFQFVFQLNRAACMIY